MSKNISNDKREQLIEDLISSIRKNTKGSRCIDVFETLLNEVEDKNMVDAVISDMSHFLCEFFRLSNEVDRMKNKDYISNILSYKFIKPDRFFSQSRKYANRYLAASDIIRQTYHESAFKDVKCIYRGNTNIIGNLGHNYYFYSKQVMDIMKYLSNLGIKHYTVEQLKVFLDKARKVVLLYNYMPAIIKALVMNKRREVGLDNNSKKY